MIQSFTPAELAKFEKGICVDLMTATEEEILGEDQARADLIDAFPRIAEELRRAWNSEEELREELKGWALANEVCPACRYKIGPHRFCVMR